MNRYVAIFYTPADYYYGDNKLKLYHWKIEENNSKIEHEIILSDGNGSQTFYSVDDALES